MSTPKLWLRERAKRIRSARQREGFTQQRVAAELGLRRPAVSEIEAGRRDLSLAEGFLLARLLNVGTDWLVGDGYKAGFVG